MRCNITGPINCKTSCISFRPAAIRNGIPKAAAMLYNNLYLYYNIWKQNILCFLLFIPFLCYTIKNWFRLITFSKLYILTDCYDNWGKSSWLRVLLLPNESKGLSHKKRIFEKKPAFSSKLSWLSLLTQTYLYGILTPSFIWHWNKIEDWLFFQGSDRKRSLLWHSYYCFSFGAFLGINLWKCLQGR